MCRRERFLEIRMYLGKALCGHYVGVRRQNKPNRCLRGVRGRARTCSLWSHRPALYQLSYADLTSRYIISLNKVLNFFRLTFVEIAPKRYFDLGFCFFFISMQLFCWKQMTEPSFRGFGKFDLKIKPLQISPFVLYLNLKPLYSTLGGSTERADPLTKYPSSVTLRLKPLYKWKICSQFTFVLSETSNQVLFWIIKLWCVFFLPNPLSPIQCFVVLKSSDFG